MKINVLSPQGYCGGVKHAIEIVNKVIKDPNTKKPIYLLGQIIHNEHVINEIKSKGVIVLEGKSKSTKSFSSLTTLLLFNNLTKHLILLFSNSLGKEETLSGDNEGVKSVVFKHKLLTIRL